ncbi:MAG: methyl-accepting chemotaxis protein [Deltaproteobacteria bacterium]|nr:methyl-accepting chemotaxis protein [Deltaproteobacteria bacterium]
MFKNLSIGLKLAIGFGVATILLALVAYIGYNGLNNGDIGFSSYRKIAIDNVNVGRIQANFLSMRVNNEKYQASHTKDIFNRFRQRTKQTYDLISETDSKINNPKKKKVITDIKAGIEKYVEGFNLMHKSYLEREKLVYTDMQTMEEKILKSLTAMSKKAQKNAEPEVVVRAEDSITAILNARLAVTKFVYTSRSQFSELASSKLALASTKMEGFNVVSKDPSQISDAEKIKGMIQQYGVFFKSAAKTVTDMADVQKNIFNVAGPKIAKEIEDLKLMMKSEQDEIGPRVKKENTDAVRLSLIFAGIGLLLAVVFALFITKAITTPVNKISEVAEGFASGDLKRTIDINQKDEIGKLADIFKKMQGILEGFSSETNKLVKATDDGNLQVRADSGSFQGDWASMLDGVNRLSESYKKPIEVTSSYLADISSGIIPKQITDTYHGEFNSIKNNINQTVNVMNDLLKTTNNLASAAQNGNLKTRADASRFDGGWGELISGINGMIDSIMEPINEADGVLEKLANYDLTSRVVGEYRGDHARIKNNINLMANALHDALSQVNESVFQVKEAVGQISSSSQQVAEGASEQASSLEETSSSLEEMAGMTRQNADNSQQANNLAQSAKKAADSGSANMDKLIDAMTRIKASAVGTSAIIQDINEIAFQTNLLALNAAVEAARAGEAGRGFAVVAEEVRNLALRSKDAAKKTEDLIKESVDVSEEGAQMSNGVKTQLDDMLEAIAKVENIIKEIAVASQEQARGIDQVNSAVAQMNEVTQLNAANAEESSSASEELSAQALELASLVEKFILNSSMGSRMRNPVKSLGSGTKKPSAGKRAPALKAPSKKPEDVIPFDDDDDMDFKEF